MIEKYSKMKKIVKCNIVALLSVNEATFFVTTINAAKSNRFCDDIFEKTMSSMNNAN